MLHEIKSSSAFFDILTANPIHTRIDMSAPSSGLLRFNTNTSAMEVFDGNSNTWSSMYGSNASINLNHEATEALKWAVKRMAEEREWEILAKKNKTIELALENLKKSQEHLKITVHIARENERMA